MKSIFFSALLLTSVSASALDLLQFSQKYQGLYESEISDRAAFAQEFVTRARIGESNGSNMTYNDSLGEATITLNSVENKLGTVALVDKCKATGRAAGVTAFGVRRSFTRQTCHRVFVRGYDDLAFGELEPKLPVLAGSLFKVSLTPDEFRRLKAAGYLEMTVALTPSISSGIVVEKDTSYASATTSYPYETGMTVYHLHGQVRELLFYLPGSKKPFGRQQVN